MLRASLLVVAVIAVAGFSQGPPDAAAHKSLMDDAGDAQEDLRDAITAKSGPKAAELGAKIDALMKDTETYWQKKNAADGVKIAQDCEALAKQIVTAAKANNFDQTGAAFAKMNTACSACHDLHLEKR